MSCIECAPYGLSSCPMCEVEPEMETCPECNGDCYFYYDEDNNEVTKEAYDKFSYKYEKYECLNCNGYGEVEIEPYEPDPDHEYDSRRNGDYD